MPKIRQERLKVLVVDDEKSNLKILSEILKEDADIILATNGSQAIKKTMQFMPDIILLDVVMPDMDGFEVIEQLKNDPRTSLIPVIFITSLSDATHEEKGLAMGACDYIQKPFNTAIVQARVKLHLQLARQRAILEHVANIDPLTSIANRRRYEEVFDIEWRAAVREKNTLTLVVIDIDYFKQYNDHFGHAGGDSALVSVAQVLSENLRRAKDFIARYGGEEFVVLLPNTSQEKAFDIVEGCRRAVQGLKIKQSDEIEREYLSVSIGGVSYVPSQECRPFKVFNMADDALYKAKKQGRNCIVWHE